MRSPRGGLLVDVGSVAQDILAIRESGQFGRLHGGAGAELATEEIPAIGARLFLIPKRELEELSPWSRSAVKRTFDCGAVLLALPVLLPILLMVAAAVRLTSSGPVLFLQTRVGSHGRLFTILKFRTMTHDADAHAVTTADNQPFTPIGPFLRRWKLDELPQIFNVLVGHMSLVGPRPKMPEHVKVDLLCRPGITGAATIAFAREEMILDRVPKHSLNAYYHNVVLPTKRCLDAEYMARATFPSDLKLIANSVLRRWDESAADSLRSIAALEAETRSREPESQMAPAFSIGRVVSEPISLRTGTR